MYCHRDVCYLYILYDLVLYVLPEVINKMLHLKQSSASVC